MPVSTQYSACLYNIYSINIRFKMKSTMWNFSPITCLKQVFTYNFSFPAPSLDLLLPWTTQIQRMYPHILSPELLSHWNTHLFPLYLTLTHTLRLNSNFPQSLPWLCQAQHELRFFCNQPVNCWMFQNYPDGCNEMLLLHGNLSVAERKSNAQLFLLPSPSHLEVHIIWMCHTAQRFWDIFTSNFPVVNYFTND